MLTFEPCNATTMHFISYLCDDKMMLLSSSILDARFFARYTLWNLLLLQWSFTRFNDISNVKTDLHDFCQARFCVKCHGAWFEDHSCLVFKRREELFKDLEWFYRKLLPQIISDHSGVVMRHGPVFFGCYPLVIEHSYGKSPFLM